MYVSKFVHEAARAQGKIDIEEKEDLYKQFPKHEIRDEVATAASAARTLVGAVLKLESLSKEISRPPFLR
jgi:hypothetical protein